MKALASLGLAVLIFGDSGALGTERRVGAWSILEKKDPITDTPLIIAWIDSPDLSGAWLQIDCRNGAPHIAIKIPAIKFRPKERTVVVMRIDDAAPTKAELSPAPDTGIAGARLTRSTYSSIVSAKKIAVRLFREAGDSWTTVFSATGAATALAPILGACPLSSAREGTPSFYNPKEPLFGAALRSQEGVTTQTGAPEPDAH